MPAHFHIIRTLYGKQEHTRDTLVVETNYQVRMEEAYYLFTAHEMFSFMEQYICNIHSHTVFGVSPSNLHSNKMY